MTERCDICSLELQNEHDLQVHLAGKRHIRKMLQTNAIERSVVVSSLPKTIRRQELINFFQGFGEIKSYKFGRDSVIIEFNDSESTTTLLKKPVWMNSMKLDIKRRVPQNGSNTGKRGQNNKAEDTSPISYKKIKNVITKEPTFNEQLTAFLNEVQLSDADIETTYESVVVQLNIIFRKIFPHCKAQKFGSTLAGLCFIGCDLDIYIDIGEPVYENDDAPPGSWTMQRIFKQARKTMYKMNCVFSDIVSIPRAKTPIIKFRHVKTDICCDISFKNGNGIYKTRLIKHCISLDVRLKPLIMLIKYWSKHFGISGSGHLSSYALILLTIFYLQQPSVNIVPPLVKLQCESRAITVNGWPVGLENDPGPLPITNTNSIPQLLHGFFFFYATFEFRSQVICPLDGLAHRHSKFDTLEGLSESMSTYVNFAKTGKCSKFDTKRPACLQDPIEHNNNVTASTCSTSLRNFIKYCAIGTEICAATSRNDYNDLLVTLLDTVQKPASKKHKVRISIPAKQWQLANLPVNSAVSANVAEDTTTFDRDNWYFTIFNIVKDVFEKVFKLKVKILSTDADTEAKQQKVESLSDVHTNEQREIMFHCNGTHKVWRNRKVSGVILETSLSRLEKEASISDQTISAASDGDTAATGATVATAIRPDIDCICVCEKKLLPHRLLLTLRNENSSNRTFNEFADYAKRDILMIVNETLIHMHNFAKQ